MIILYLTESSNLIECLIYCIFLQGSLVILEQIIVIVWFVSLSHFSFYIIMLKILLYIYIYTDFFIKVVDYLSIYYAGFYIYVIDYLSIYLLNNSLS